MKLALIGFFFLLSPLAMVAQSNDEAQIKAVITSLFEGMKAGDTAKIRATFAHDAIMATIKSSPGAEPTVINDKPEGFIKSISSHPIGVLDEQITFASFYSDGILATVTTPYRFYYKGNFSHCGTNAFQLVKFNEGWKIQYIIDTRLKTGCD